MVAFGTTFPLPHEPAKVRNPHPLLPISQRYRMDRRRPRNGQKARRCVSRCRVPRTGRRRLDWPALGDTHRECSTSTLTSPGGRGEVAWRLALEDRDTTTEPVTDRSSDQLGQPL